MQVHTAPFVLRLPRSTDELVSAMFTAATKMLKRAGTHKTTVITLFDGGNDYVGHYHVLEPDPGEGDDVPSIAPVLRKEMPDAFMMVSESVVQLTGKDSHGRSVSGPSDQQGPALFLVFHSKTADRLLYQVFSRKMVKGKVEVRLGYKFQDDKAPTMPGLGNLVGLDFRPSYIG